MTKTKAVKISRYSTTVAARDAATIHQGGTFVIPGSKQEWGCRGFSQRGDKVVFTRIVAVYGRAPRTVRKYLSHGALVKLVWG